MKWLIRALAVVAFVECIRMSVGFYSQMPSVINSAIHGVSLDYMQWKSGWIMTVISGIGALCALIYVVYDLYLEWYQKKYSRFQHLG